MWTWDPASRRYRASLDGAEALGQKPGTFVGQAKMLTLRDEFIDARKGHTNDLANQLATGAINLNQWTVAMRQEIKDNFICQYTLAHGGRNTLTQADYGRLGQMIKGQYQYLDNFAADIASGKFTEQALAARARMYIEASSHAFERGKVLQTGMPDLPAYPGDGNTRCLSNCKCSWQIKETDTAWEATWTLGLAEHCDDCISNAGRWNPLVMTKGIA